MKETMDPRRDQGGFTLIELMISLVLFAFAVAGVMSVAVATTRAFREQRAAIATENAARAPLDYLVDALRGASPGAPSGIIGDADQCTTGAAIRITDSSTAPDSLDVVYAAGGVVTTTYSAFSKTSTTITIPAAQLANFPAGDYALITDTSQGTIVKVTGVTASALQVAPASSCAVANVYPSSGSYAAGSILVRAQQAHFSIADLDGIPTLWMDPDGTTGPANAEPVAEGVEDMQLAIGIDTDASGTLTDNGTTADEWTGNAAGDVLPGTGSIRAIKIVLVARDTKALTGVASFYRPAALDRAGSLSADNYRRRVLKSVVEIRNLTGSP